MASKLRQPTLPMSLLRSVIKHHVGDLRIFAPRPESAHTGSTNQNNNAADARVPLDIIIEIAERLDTREDIVNLSLAVRLPTRPRFRIVL